MAGFGDKRLQDVLKGKRAVAAVHYPGEPDIKMGIRILNDGEHDEAREAAAKYTAHRAKALLIEAPMLLTIDPEHTEPEIQRQIIFRAFIDLDGPKPPAITKPFFDTDTAIRQLPAVDREVLFQLYVEHQNAVSPLSTLDEEQTKELVDALKKGRASKALLALYDAPTLRILVGILASQRES